LNEQQIRYIKEQLKDLDYSEEDINTFIGYFNEISQHLSKQSFPRDKTVLDSFFENVNANYQRISNPTLEQKREIFRGLFSAMYYRFHDNEPNTDVEDND